jgi:hypothetical protein
VARHLAAALPEASLIIAGVLLITMQPLHAQSSNEKFGGEDFSSREEDKSYFYFALPGLIETPAKKFPR